MNGFICELVRGPLPMDRDVPVENMVMFERSEYEMWRLRLMNIYEREVDGDEDEEGK